MRALQILATWDPKKEYHLTDKEIAEKRALKGNHIYRNPVLEMVEKEMPKPKDDEVLVKIGACGVCGSDIELLFNDDEGYTNWTSQCKWPCTIGHEFAGEVIECGKDVKYLQNGDLITLENTVWCGNCMSCRMGMFNHCENLDEIGFTADGGFAEYAVVKKKNCYRINDFINVFGSKEQALKVGALTEPVAVVYNGMFIRAGGFLPGSNVVVFGCGMIGLAAIALAKTAGAAKVIAFGGSSEYRLKLAQKVGADYVFSTAALKREGCRPADVIMEITEHRGASMMVEATEHLNATIPEMEDSLAVGGKIVQIGFSATKTNISSTKYQKCAASYIGTNGNAGHNIYPMIINLVTSGRLDLSPVISRCYDIDHAIDAIKDSKKTSEGKFLVTPFFNQ